MEAERNFSMALSDLGDPDVDFAYLRQIIQHAHGCGGGGGAGDPGLAKWTVQEAAGGRRQFGVEFFQDGGFRIYTQGRRDNEPEADEAEVHFTGKTLDGTVFASSIESGTPLTVKLTQEDAMQGFILAIASMQPGEKAVFTIPRELLSLSMCGCHASIPWKIPPDQTLRFDIELISLATDILRDGGILKKTIRSGRGMDHPDDSNEVFVNHFACLKDGTPVSQSEGVEFILSEGFFCPAIQHALKTMVEGEESILIIKPEYGFGREGRPSRGNEVAVPPDETLHVKLRLISWKSVSLIGEFRDILKKIPRKQNRWSREKPCNEAVVKVRLIGKLEDGTVFDKRGHDGDDPFEFTIDEEHVIHGLDEAVMTMEIGEISSFTIPPQHAFGAFGSSQYQLAVVPPNSHVIYEIELLSIANEKLWPWDMTEEQTIEHARMKENIGDELLNSRKYLRAYRRYMRARQILRWLYGRSSDKDRIIQMLILLATKIAECAIQLQRYEQAVDRYREVLKYDPNNLRAQRMLAQTFPKASVGIDIAAMHRGLEEDFVPPVLTPCSGSVMRLKQRHECSGRMIFVPPAAVTSHAASAVPAPAAGQSPYAPAPPAAGSSGATGGTLGKSPGTATARKKKTGLRAWLGSLSSSTH